MTLGGQIIFDEVWKIADLRTLRRDRIGFIFQAPYLIPFLDVTDNVALLPMLAGVANAPARSRALELLNALDVGHRAKAAVAQLSGGEQQRVSIARALASPTSRPRRWTANALSTWCACSSRWRSNIRPRSLW
jgi:putative ABC transport system ATP-binding protein